MIRNLRKDLDELDSVQMSTTARSPNRLGLLPVRLQEALIFGYVRGEYKSVSNMNMPAELCMLFVSWLFPISPKPKICVGDKVVISTINKKIVKGKGTVCYIGYPYPEKGVRYGINLVKPIGDNNGSLMLHIKGGKLARPSHVKKYRTQVKKRKFFTAKKKRGIFVILEEIIDIESEASMDTRLTIEDKVTVRFRGVGTIKFIGYVEQLHKEKGIWYGIYLKQRRGRHDGSINGVRYFEAASQCGLHCRRNHLKLVTEKKKETVHCNDRVRQQPSNKWKS